MIITPGMSLAESIAREAHEGQEYAPGLSYIEGHIQAGVIVIRRLGYGALFQDTFWLHDTPEDHGHRGYDLQYLLDRGVDPLVVHSTDLLTKKKGQPHDEYLEAISTDLYATVGKFVDSSINYANTLLNSPNVYPPKFISRAETYAGNIAFLLPYLPPPDELHNIVRLDEAV